MVIESNLLQRKKIDTIIAICYTLAATVGGYPIIEMKLAGIVPTYYRVLIPLLLAYYIIERLRNTHYRLYNRIYYTAIFVFAMMMIWGTVQLFLADYVEKSTGMRELFMLGLGVCSVLVIYEICMREMGYNTIICCLRVVVVVITLISLVEMATDLHMAASKFSDPVYIERYQSLVGQPPGGGRIPSAATGTFYNENDLSAFLGALIPIFFPQNRYKMRLNVLFIIEMILIVVILSQNDAWICLVSPVVGTIAYLIITRKKFRVWVAAAAGFLVTKFFALKIFTWLIYIIYKILPGVDVPEGFFIKLKQGTAELPTVLKNQLATMEGGTGSMYMRLNTYFEGVKRTVTETYGLGYGPGSYTKYVVDNPDSHMLKNPHSMWLEIFMQYGAVIFLLFIIVLIWIFIKLCILYHETHRQEYAVMIAMDVIFVLICFAPSSYFTIEYMWIPIGISLALSNIRLERAAHLNRGGLL